MSASASHFSRGSFDATTDDPDADADDGAFSGDDDHVASSQAASAARASSMFPHPAASPMAQKADDYRTSQTTTQPLPRSTSYSSRSYRSQNRDHSFGDDSSSTVQNSASHPVSFVEELSMTRRLFIRFQGAKISCRMQLMGDPNSTSYSISELLNRITTSELAWRECLAESRAAELVAAVSVSQRCMYKLDPSDIQFLQPFTGWASYLSTRSIAGLLQLERMTLVLTPRAAFPSGSNHQNSLFIIGFPSSKFPFLKWRCIEPPNDLLRFVPVEYVQGKGFHVFGPNDRTMADLVKLLTEEMKMIRIDVLTAADPPYYVFVHRAATMQLHLLPNFLKWRRNHRTRFVLYGFSPEQPRHVKDAFTPILTGGGLLSFDTRALIKNGAAVLMCLKTFLDDVATVPYESWQIVLHDEVYRELQRMAKDGAKTADDTCSAINRLRLSQTASGETYLRMFSLVEETPVEDDLLESVCDSMARCYVLEMYRKRRFIVVSGSKPKNFPLWRMGVELISLAEFQETGIL